MLSPRIIRFGSAMAGAVMLVTATGTNAQSQTTASVRYKAAELRTEAGMRALLHRINSAANLACFTPDNVLRVERRACRDELAGQIVGKIGDPALLAAWNNGDRNVQLASRAR